MESFMSSAVESITRLNERAVDVVESLVDQLAAAAKSADGFVRSSPWQAAAAGAVASIAAGILVSRGARRSRRFATDRDYPSEVTGG